MSSRSISPGYQSVLLPIILFLCVLTYAETYYVSPTGTSSGTGLDTEHAWDVTTACNGAGAGDTVLFADGVYTGGWNSGQVKIIEKVGTKDLRLVWKSINKWGAVIKAGPTSWPGVLFYRCVGVVVDGLAFDGSNVEMTGLEFGECNHVTIRNCKIYNTGGGGIGAGYDNLLIENNILWNNAKRKNTSSESGISIYEPIAQDNDTESFGIILRGNICFDNAAPPYANGDAPTDGNGIIIDDWRHTQNPGVPYAKKGLVENNLCFNNGGHGIHLFFSDRVTVRNNTVWHNNTVLRDYQTRPGEITFAPSNNSECYNNVIVATDDGDGALTLEAQDVFPVQNNIIVGSVNSANSATTMASALSLNNQVVAVTEQNYVLFVNASTDSDLADFRVMQGSPAIDAGNNENAAPVDLDGQMRPVGTMVDIGAYEYQPATTIPRMPGWSPTYRIRTGIQWRNVDVAGRSRPGPLKPIPRLLPTLLFYR